MDLDMKRLHLLILSGMPGLIRQHDRREPCNMSQKSIHASVVGSTSSLRVLFRAPLLCLAAIFWRSQVLDTGGRPRQLIVRYVPAVSSAFIDVSRNNPRGRHLGAGCCFGQLRSCFATSAMIVLAFAQSRASIDNNDVNMFEQDSSTIRGPRPRR